MHLSDLQTKEIIDITSGRRLGIIIDVIVDISGKIKSLVLQEKRIKKFKMQEESEVAWSEIIKIGDDIILIDPRNKNNWFLYIFVIKYILGDVYEKMYSYI